MCNTSLDGLICVNGASCGGVNVVNPATGEVLMTCPRVDVVDCDAFPFAAIRYYTTFPDSSNGWYFLTIERWPATLLHTTFDFAQFRGRSFKSRRPPGTGSAGEHEHAFHVHHLSSSTPTHSSVDFNPKHHPAFLRCRFRPTVQFHPSRQALSWTSSQRRIICFSDSLMPISTPAAVDPPPEDIVLPSFQSTDARRPPRYP